MYQLLYHFQVYWAVNSLTESFLRAFERPVGHNKTPNVSSYTAQVLSEAELQILRKKAGRLEPRPYWPDTL